MLFKQFKMRSTNDTRQSDKESTKAILTWNSPKWRTKIQNNTLTV